VPRSGGEVDAVCPKLPDPTPLAAAKTASGSTGGSELHGMLGFRG
jgi:hypothetical protein